MLSLKANTRKILGRGVKKLKRENIVPAVIYGRGFESQNLEVDKNNFDKVFSQSGTNTIIDLLVDEKTNFKILVHDLQYDPISDEVMHIDF
jgi:large subunit ribosomal protein L25